jgi:hypothetical protein
MNTELKDMQIVQKAKLSPTIKGGAQGLVVALHTLRRIAKEQGITLEQITAEHIISDSSALDAEVQRCSRLAESIRKKA